MHIAFHPRAVEDAATIDAWWKVNRRAAPDLFREELENTVALVADAPALGTPTDDFLNGQLDDDALESVFTMGRCTHQA